MPGWDRGEDSHLNLPRRSPLCSGALAVWLFLTSGFTGSLEGPTGALTGDAGKRGSDEEENESRRVETGLKGGLQPNRSTPVTFCGGCRGGGSIQPVSIQGQERASLQAAGDVFHPHHRRLVLPDAAQPVGAQAGRVAGQDQRALWESVGRGHRPDPGTRGSRGQA